MGDNIISLRSVSRSFRHGNRHVRALGGLDLDVLKGEFVTIYGKSGSGKTTLLNVIAGLLAPNSGRVTVAGLDIYSVSDAARSHFRNENIGFIFQQFFLIRYLNCEENLSLPGLFSRWKSRELAGRVDKVLEMMGLESMRESYPTALSGGQQQRIAIGRALLMKPRILLCDEPIGDLDAETGTKILKILKNLSESEGVTVIVVSHEEKVSAISDRTLFLMDGKLHDDKAS